MINVVFNEFAVLMALSVIVGIIALKIRQPLILSFIIVGIIAGPGFLGWIRTQNEIEILASFGITLLLFIVGLKLDLNVIRSFGRVVLIAGLGQIVMTTLLGGLIGVMMGFEMIPAFYLAFTLTFSSTIIIIKILSDNDEIDALYGRISVGILIVQDLVVIAAIIILTSLRLEGSSYNQLGLSMLVLILKGAGLIMTLGILMRWIFPWLLAQLARSRELLILFAFSWAVILAAAGDYLGFGKEVGGFLAGVSLASSHYREAMASRLESVRNLLLLFFFLNLGASLRFDALETELISALILSVFVLFAKPLIVMLLMSGFRFRKRTSFLTGLTMGQVSEFSLIMAALGVNLGYINSAIASMVTFIGVVTIALSSYMMTYANVLYRWLSPFLGVMQRKAAGREFDAGILPGVDIIIYGFGRHGIHMANHLVELGYRILGIDFDPRKISHTHNASISLKYGDAEDVEFIKSLPLDNVKWIVSTIPHHDVNKTLVTSLRESRYKGKIALSIYHEGEISMSRKLSVDMLFVPYEDAAMSAAKWLAEHMSGGKTLSAGTGSQTV